MPGGFIIWSGLFRVLCWGPKPRTVFEPGLAAAGTRGGLRIADQRPVAMGKYVRVHPKPSTLAGFDVQDLAFKFCI